MAKSVRTQVSRAAVGTDAASGAAAPESPDTCFRKLEETTIASFRSTRSSRRAIVKWLKTSEAPQDHALEDDRRAGAVVGCAQLKHSIAHAA
jgi:hypothetical protein